MEIETTIVGAGLIGLAIAAELSRQHRNIYVIESGTTFGATSSRRPSEVLHAGLVYSPGSLKARLCKRGNRLLRDLCRTKDIPLRMCGKLIVASNPEEEYQIESMARLGQESGIRGLNLLTGPAAQKMEPQLRALAALYVPTSGIVDSRQLIRYFVAQAGMNGVTFVYQTRIQRVVRKEPGLYTVHIVYPDGQLEQFVTRRLINAAGLDADQIAAGLGLDIDRLGHRQYPWKGTYYAGRRTPSPLNHIIYPVPAPRTEGPGVGAWTDLNDRFILGPKAVFLSQSALDGDGDPDPMDNCFDSIRRYLPHLRGKDFAPVTAGLWPKLSKPGDPERDFVIQEESSEGFPGIVNLLGIESPGLTACMAIAEHVKRLIV